MASFFGNVIDYIFGETDTLDSKNIIIDNVKRNNYSSIAAKASEGILQFPVIMSNTIDFDTAPEIEDLNDQNCLFIDNLSDEDLIATKDAIKLKIIQVLSDKNKNLNIIEINNENSVVQQIEQTQTPR